MGRTCLLYKDQLKPDKTEHRRPIVISQNMIQASANKVRLALALAGENRYQASETTSSAKVVFVERWCGGRLLQILNGAEPCSQMGLAFYKV